MGYTALYIYIHIIYIPLKGTYPDVPPSVVWGVVATILERYLSMANFRAFYDARDQPLKGQRVI